MRPSCRTDKQENHPTSVMLVLSRTQVHAFRGFDVLELVLGGRLRLGHGGCLRAFTAKDE